jgi:hypothetical protein
LSFWEGWTPNQKYSLALLFILVVAGVVIPIDVYQELLDFSQDFMTQDEVQATILDYIDQEIGDSPWLSEKSYGFLIGTVDLFNDTYFYGLNGTTGGLWEYSRSLEIIVEWAWSNLTSGGIIILNGPGETWTVDEQINSQSNYVTLKSDWSLTLKARANLDAYMISVKHDYITFESLSLEGNGPKQGAGTWGGILVAGEHIGIYHCYFTNFDFAPIRMEGNAADVDIDSCTFYKNQGIGGISSTGSNHRIRVRGNIFDQNSQGLTADPDVEIYSGGYDWAITNNIFYESGYSAVYIVGTASNKPHDIAVSNNIVINATDGGGLRAELARGLTFSNNIINSSTHYGYLLKQVQDVSIEGGFIYDTNQWGIGVSTTDGIPVSRLTIRGVIFRNVGNINWVGGIILDGTDGGIEKVIIDSCIFYNDETNNQFSVGVYLLDGTEDITVSDSDFDGMVNFGIQIYSAADGNRTIITGNRFANLNTGIEADGGEKVLVANNYFHATLMGIDMDNAACSNWLVTGNDFEDTADDVSASNAVDPHWGDNVDASGNWDHDIEP